MKTYFFRIHLNYEQCQDLYTGRTTYAVVTAESGQRIRIPASNLRPFIGQYGIRGRFRLITNQNNKILSFESVS
ncbi:DUF2835 family protein [Lacimicrobium sp. SS2-24]|uniref:DUF2835 family protein n=1 Tax=Lacimicrobium sp. SS2-24 TaxID=2005569 RepID=UPI000B4BE17B|nr:DUF2835 family protein [Lacimicrobium sp. SS2-24]